MKILAFAASLRRSSWNRKLIGIAAEVASTHGAEIDLADFHEFDVPLFDGDLLSSSGVPAGAREFARRITAADGVMISSPEYNFSLPGTLKNLIDWVSRVKPVPLRGKSGMLLSASTAQVGGIRGLWQLRIPLEGLGMILHPDMYTLPWAEKMFDGDGRLSDEERRVRLEGMLTGYLTMTRKLVTPLPGS
ncbi:MAG: NADPH-dependent FMN reductase [Gemmatimonadales bacterium]